MKKCLLVSDRGVWKLPQGETFIGRFRHCGVRIDAEGLAGEHARLALDDERLVVEDLGGDSGTYLNGLRIVGVAEFSPGQILRTGPVSFRLHLVEGSAWPVALPLRLFGRAFAAAALLALVAMVSLRVFYNSERVRKIAIEAIEGALGRDGTIASVEYGLLGRRVEFGGVTVKNLPEFGAEPLLQIPGMVVETRRAGYRFILGGRRRAEAVIRQPAIFIERNERGAWNVSDLLARAAASSRPGMDLSVRVENATVRIRDDFLGRSSEIRGVSLDFRLEEVSGRAEFALEIGAPFAGGAGSVSLSGGFDGLGGGDARLAIRDFDARFIPAVESLAFLPRGSLLALDAEAVAAGNEAISLVFSGSLGGVAFGGVSSLDAAEGEASLTEGFAAGEGWRLDAQGRAVASSHGAEILDLDVGLRGRLDRLGWLVGKEAAGVGGEVEANISTTGSTESLGVRGSLRMPAHGLSARFAGALGFDGSRLESVAVDSLAVESAFVKILAPPGRVSGLSNLGNLTAEAGPLQIELDTAEFGARFGGLLPFRLPDTRLRVLAAVSGAGGRLEVRHHVEPIGGPRLEGMAIVQCLADGLKIILDEQVKGEGGLAGALTGTVALESGREPVFDIAVDAEGELAEALGFALHVLNPPGAVRASGAFRLLDVRLEGDARRMRTRGRIELLGTEIWGADPAAPPFAESRFDAIWNLELDRSEGPVRLKANLFKGTSSLARFRVEGEVEDLRHGLGRYEVEAVADFERVAALVTRLGIMPELAELKGSFGVDLSADTRVGLIELRSLFVDTPSMEAEGRGIIRDFFPAELFLPDPTPDAKGRSPSGDMRVSCRIDADSLAHILGPASGRIAIDVNASGSAEGLLLGGVVDLDALSGRLGRLIQKSADERASFRFEAAVTPGGEDLLTLRSGTLTFGRAGEVAALDISGALSAGARAFRARLQTKSFPLSPFGAALPALVFSGGGASADVSVAGALEGGALVPSSLRMNGSARLDEAAMALRSRPGVVMALSGGLNVRGVEVSSSDLAAAVFVDAGGERTEAGVLRFESLALSPPRLPGVPLGRFVASADRFDLGGVLAALSRDAGVSAGRPRPHPLAMAALEAVAPRVTGTVRVSRVGLFRGFTAEDVEAAVSASPFGVRARIAAFTFLGGKGSGVARLKEPGGRLMSEGSVAVESAALPALLEGAADIRVAWSGAGFAPGDFERSWTVDIAGETGEVVLDVGAVPLAAEVERALGLLFGESRASDVSRLLPGRFGVRAERGRVDIDVPDAATAAGVGFSLDFRTRLDGSLAGWLGILRLPEDDSIAPARRRLFSSLVEKGLLRFAVGGAWAEPKVDVRGLLWMLLGEVR